MTAATINKVNAAIEKYGVELVKGNGYFYFMDTGEDFVADLIDSVYSTTLRGMTLESWVKHVEDSLAN